MADSNATKLAAAIAALSGNSPSKDDADALVEALIAAGLEEKDSGEYTKRWPKAKNLIVTSAGFKFFSFESCIFGSIGAVGHVVGATSIAEVTVQGFEGSVLKTKEKVLLQKAKAVGNSTAAADMQQNLITEQN